MTDAFADTVKRALSSVSTEFWKKVVPITWDFLHYMEPNPHAIKRKTGERGFGNGPAC
jgi:hypothetical protein